MILLDKRTQFRYFEIWEPRYSTKDVLLAVRKVGAHNKIVFTKSKSMGTEPYYVSGTTIKECKKAWNGSIDCYAVSLDKLQPLELTENSEFDWR